METPTNANIAPNKGSVRIETVPIDSLRCYQSMNPKMYIGIIKGVAFLLVYGLACAIWVLLIYSLFDSAFWGRELLNNLDNGIAFGLGILLPISIPFCVVAILFFLGLYSASLFGLEHASWFRRRNSYLGMVM